jgi:hypothetical protein
VVSSFEVLQNRFRSSCISQNETTRAAGAGPASRWVSDILGVGEGSVPEQLVLYLYPAINKIICVDTPAAQP